MRAVGISQDFHILISNAGLEHFVGDEPYQYVKLTIRSRSSVPSRQATNYVQPGGIHNVTSWEGDVHGESRLDH